MSNRKSQSQIQIAISNRKFKSQFPIAKSNRNFQSLSYGYFGVCVGVGVSPPNPLKRRTFVAACIVEHPLQSIRSKGFLYRLEITWPLEIRSGEV